MGQEVKFRRHRTRRGERGVVLIHVLWLSMLVSLVAGSVALSTRSATRETRTYLDVTAVRAVADGAIALGVYEVLKRGRRSDKVWRGTDVAAGYVVDGVTVTLYIQDESGKIDLNRAPEALLREMFLANGVSSDKADAMTDAIADWRDGNPEPRPHGAEGSDYRHAGYDYGPRDGPFETVDELAVVFGMTQDLFDRISPLVTVYSGKRGVDPASASRGVVAALSSDAEDKDVKQFVSGRASENGRHVRSALRKIGVPRRFLASSGHRAFSIRAVARSRNGTTFVREAIVSLKGGIDSPYHVLVWRQGPPDNR